MAKPQYDSAWRKVRLLVLARDGYICQLRDPGCTRHAGDVDHIISVKERPDLRLVLTNLRAACAHCNRSRGGMAGNARRHRSKRGQPSRDW